MADIELGSLVYRVRYVIESDKALRDKRALEGQLGMGGAGGSNPSAANVSPGAAAAGARPSGPNWMTGQVGVTQPGSRAGPLWNDGSAWMPPSGGRPPSASGSIGYGMPPSGGSPWDRRFDNIPSPVYRPPPRQSALSRLNQIGQTNVMGTGMFMNFLFGGWEVYTAMNAANAAERFATANPSDLQGQLNAQNQALDKITQGPLGSLAGHLVGAAGVRERIAAVESTAKAQDARGLLTMTRAGMREGLKEDATMAGVADPIARAVTQAGLVFDKTMKDARQLNREIGARDADYLQKLRQERSSTLEERVEKKIREGKTLDEFTALPQAHQQRMRETYTLLFSRADLQDLNTTERERRLQREKMMGEDEALATQVRDASMRQVAGRQFQTRGMTSASIAFNRSVAAKGFESVDDVIAKMEADRKAKETGMIIAGADLQDVFQFGTDELGKQRALRGKQGRADRLGLASSFGALKVGAMSALGFGMEAEREAVRQNNAARFRASTSPAEGLSALMLGAGDYVSTVGSQRERLLENRNQLVATQEAIRRRMTGLFNPEEINPGTTAFQSGASPSPTEEEFKAALGETNRLLQSIDTQLQTL